MSAAFWVILNFMHCVVFQIRIAALSLSLHRGENHSFIKKLWAWEISSPLVRILPPLSSGEGMKMFYRGDFLRPF